MLLRAEAEVGWLVLCAGGRLPAVLPWLAAALRRRALVPPPVPPPLPPLSADLGGCGGCGVCRGELLWLGSLVGSVGRVDRAALAPAALLRSCEALPLRGRAMRTSSTSDSTGGRASRKSCDRVDCVFAPPLPVLLLPVPCECWVGVLFPLLR